MSEAVPLLLVGRSGHGKSSTGNAVLGTKAFKVRPVGHSVKDDLADAKGEVNGRKVQVVDGSGLTDSDQEFPDNVGHLIDLAKRAMGFPLGVGYFALILILRYGVRFTKQESTAVNLLKSLFGSEVIQRHGVIVMTGGDQFLNDAEDEGVSFHQWCGQQEGEVKRLMEECGQRCVLFDNKTKDPERQRQQVQQLMNMVDQVKGQNGHYTKAGFERAEPGRRKLLVSAKLPRLEQELDFFLREINQRLAQVKLHDPVTQKQELQDIFDDVQKFEAHLQQEDEGTGCLERLSTKLDITKSRVTMMLTGLRFSSPADKKDSPDIRTWLKQNAWRIVAFAGISITVGIFVYIICK